MLRGIAYTALLSLAGCAGALQWNTPEDAAPVEAAPTVYTVKPGDDLYAIAFRYGLDYHDVASWNHLGPEYRIHPGDKLVMRAPAGSLRKPAPATVTARGAQAVAAPPSGPVQWAWPVEGQVVRMFHAGNTLAKGVDITAQQGAEIRAASGGKVVYAGTGIVGYGKLIIIKSSESFLSAYADNDQILVKEGDSVRIGDRIATMGLGRDNRPVLHFEIRYDGNPVDPLSYLPKR
ncbi:MAG TPA: peptidoglycan DD-metalloendopeptidase family protein [Gammaproteobacteria bacterium]|jgi:lipoprotein NlpD